jgi:hypothetical protein
MPMTTRTTPANRMLARRLIEEEARRRAEAVSVVAVAEVLHKLEGRLVKLVGARGFAALLGRSLALATAEEPALEQVELSPGGDLDALAEALSERATVDAAVSILAHFLELLATFVGAELTARLAHRILIEDGEACGGSEGT